MKKIFLVVCLTAFCGTNTYTQTNTDRDVTFQLDFGNPSQLGGMSQENLEHIKTIVQPDNNIIISGLFTHTVGTNEYKFRGIVRVNSDGEIDPTFTPPLDFSSFQIHKALLLSDGKILACGSIGNVGAGNVGIVRLNSDGTLDPAFDAGIISGATVPTTSTVYDMDLQSDGKIIIAGNIAEVDGNEVRYVARLHPNGAFDNTFDVGGGAAGSGDHRPRKVKVIQNDKILVNGAFTSWDGATTSQRIALLNADGSHDASFTFDDWGSYQFLVQSDGKVLVGGGAVGESTLRRYNSDMTVDNGFQAGSIMDTPPSSMILQPDGKILMAGVQGYDGNENRGLVRVNPDGSYDETFDVGTGFTGGSGVVYRSARGLSLQQDGKIIVCHYAQNYKEETLNPIGELEFIIRLNGDGGSGTTSLEEINNEISFTVYPNPTDNVVNINTASVGGKLKIADATGKLVYDGVITNEKTTINAMKFDSGIYIIHVENNGNQMQRKLIVNK